MRGVRSLWQGLTLAAVLAGCQSASDGPTPDGAPATSVEVLRAPPSPPPPPVVPAQSAKPESSPAPARPGPAKLRQTQVLAPLTAPATAPLLARLNGSGPERLQQWLGAPNLKRRDAPAEIWRYDAADCALYVFLYRKDAGAPLRITHASAIWRAQKAAAASANPQPCFERLWQARQTSKKGGGPKPTS